MSENQTEKTDLKPMVMETTDLINPAAKGGQVMVSLPQSPMQQLVLAKEMGLSVAELKEMMALQKEHEANEARKAFHMAMAKFKENPPKVYKDMVNAQYNNSGYVSLGNMVNSVNEAMGPFGLNARWDYEDSNEGKDISVACILSHAMGHEESVKLTGPLDVSGTKNPLQARKSTRTYLKLETFEAVTGMASITGNIDDDANSVSAEPVHVERITEDQALTIHAKVSENELRMDNFKKWVVSAFQQFDTTCIEEIPRDSYQRVIDKLDATIKIKLAKEDAE